MRLTVSAPSSGPSGHLLAAGEKREPVASSEAVDVEFGMAADTLFSPTGRSAPERQDEGNPATRQKFQNREQKP